MVNLAEGLPVAGLMLTPKGKGENVVYIFGGAGAIISFAFSICRFKDESALFLSEANALYQGQFWEKNAITHRASANRTPPVMAANLTKSRSI